MGSPNNALQTAIYNRLTGFSALTTLLGSSKIYDHVPQGATPPYVVIGDDTAIDWSTMTTNGWSPTLTIHCWDYETAGRKSVKSILSAIYDALHRQEASINVTGFNLIMLQSEFETTVQDPSAPGATDHYYHGVARYLDHWEERWADTRIHGTTKRQVAAMFAEEKPALLPLPLEPFRYYQHGKRKVNLDGCVEVDAAYYSAPPGWVGKDVSVQWDGRQVRVLHPQTGELLREHLPQVRGKHRIPDQDRTPRTPPGTQALLLRAARAGQQIGVACRQTYEEQGQEGVRRIQGLLGLARQHGPAVVEEACAMSLEAGAVNHYRFVKRYLERGPQLPLSLRQVDPLIRELTEYRDFIQSKTQENPL